MRKPIALIMAAAALALVAVHGAAALTLEEAETLPVEALAMKVLGEAGVLVIGVDRPQSFMCRGGQCAFEAI